MLEQEVFALKAFLESKLDIKPSNHEMCLLVRLIRDLPEDNYNSQRMTDYGQFSTKLMVTLGGNSVILITTMYDRKFGNTFIKYTFSHRSIKDKLFIKHDGSYEITYPSKRISE